MTDLVGSVVIVSLAEGHRLAQIAHLTSDIIRLTT
jgi:hypothetical protein